MPETISDKIRDVEYRIRRVRALVKATAFSLQHGHGKETRDELRDLWAASEDLDAAMRALEYLDSPDADYL